MPTCCSTLSSPLWDQDIIDSFLVLVIGLKIFIASHRKPRGKARQHLSRVPNAVARKHARAQERRSYQGTHEGSSVKSECSTVGTWWSFLWRWHVELCWCWKILPVNIWTGIRLVFHPIFVILLHSVSVDMLTWWTGFISAALLNWMSLKRKSRSSNGWKSVICWIMSLQVVGTLLSGKAAWIFRVVSRERFHFDSPNRWRRGEGRSCWYREVGSRPWPGSDFLYLYSRRFVLAPQCCEVASWKWMSLGYWYHHVIGKQWQPRHCAVGEWVWVPSSPSCGDHEHLCHNVWIFSQRYLWRISSIATAPFFCILHSFLNPKWTRFLLFF